MFYRSVHASLAQQILYLRCKKMMANFSQFLLQYNHKIIAKLTDWCCIIWPTCRFVKRLNRRPDKPKVLPYQVSHPRALVPFPVLWKFHLWDAKMARWQKGNSMKWQVGKMARWHHDMMKFWVDKKFIKHQVNKMPSWQKAGWENVKLTKCQVDKMPSWQNVRLTKWQWQAGIMACIKYQVEKN
jgi:hypothetical protein